VHLLGGELYRFQNAWSNDKKNPFLKLLTLNNTQRISKLWKYLNFNSQAWNSDIPQRRKLKRHKTFRRLNLPLPAGAIGKGEKLLSMAHYREAAPVSR